MRYAVENTEISRLTLMPLMPVLFSLVFDSRDSDSSAPIYRFLELASNNSRGSGEKDRGKRKREGG